MDNRQHQADIVRLLTPYLMALPQSKINASSLVIYAKALAELSLAEIEAAMLKLMRTSRYFPTIAEIFEQADNVKKFVTKSDKPTAEEAWGEAMEQARKNFVERPWQYSCDEVKLAVKRFGRNELCLLTPEGMNTARAQFMKIYNSIIQRQKDNQANKKIIGVLPNSTVQALAGKLAKGMDIENLPKHNREIYLEKR